MPPLIYCTILHISALHGGFQVKQFKSSSRFKNQKSLFGVVALISIALMIFITIEMPITASNPTTTTASEITPATSNEHSSTLDIPFCKMQEPKFGGSTSLSCKNSDAEITYEYFDDQSIILKTKSDYLLEPKNKELQQYLRIGLNTNQSRLMAIDINQLLLVNVESKTYDTNQLEKWWSNQNFD